MLRATGPWFIIKGMWLLGSNSGKLSSSLCGISVAKWFGRGIFSRFYRSVQKRRPPLLVNSQQFWMTSWVILPTASVALEDPNVSSHFFVFFLKYQFCLSHFQPNSPTTARAKCYNTLDAYCRLIALLVRHSGDASNNVTKINLLSRVSISEVRKHGWRPEIEFYYVCNRLDPLDRKLHSWLHVVLSPPRARFSKAPKTFRARKAIRKTATR